MPNEIPYQQAGHVRQLLAERANAEAIGLTSRVEAVDKQLLGLGYKIGKQSAEKVAAEAFKATPEPSKAPPQGRTVRQRQTTAKTDAEG